MSYLCLCLLRRKLNYGKEFYFSCLLLIPKFPEQCLAHGRYSTNICWMDGWMDGWQPLLSGVQGSWRTIAVTATITIDATD